MDKDIGRIVEVRGINVKAKLFRLLPPYLINNGIVVSAPKINSFVKTKVGLDTIICQVNGEYNVEKEDKATDYYIDLTVKGYIDHGKFIQGLRMLPIVSSNLSLLNNDDYAIIYDFDKDHSFFIGKDLFEINKDIYLNFNNLMPTHIGIFGNTGSGKSNTLANVYSHYIKELNGYVSSNATVLLFDLNNEYGNNSICNKQHKVIYNLTTRKQSSKRIPFSFENITEDEMSILLNASIKTQIPTIKHAFKSLKEEHEEEYYLKYVKNTIRNNQKDLFFAIRFRLNEYIKNINNINWHSNALNFYYSKDDGTRIFNNSSDFDSIVLNNIQINLPAEPLDRFKFELCFSIIRECEHGVNSEFLLPLLTRAEKIFNDLKKVFDFEDNSDIFENKNLAIIQLGNVNNDMTMIVPSLISSVIFRRQLEKKQGEEIKSIINIVLDEAHNILYKEDDLAVHNNLLEKFEKIVKEGRKFGVFLTVSSQRPSDISSTILSQLHNYFIHKLVNPNDLNQIRKAVAFLDENALNFLTILAPGECILSGTSLSMPIFIQIEELDNETKPNSNNVILFGRDGIIK
ncbi:ATP-binding protein [Faecalibacillus intestinalis]|jgi:flagellin-specific chaperone FliS|uniref:ATP-binding protein n=1 Tax=Faecalibacillus intestinalis TaxID=1982626 RepID=UPI000E4982BC|nr:ATP-binding protein [Faecalibacillus intestinalis]RGG93362.1 ATP-binding protein [Coprobacillus sp. AF16-47]